MFKRITFTLLLILSSFARIQPGNDNPLVKKDVHGVIVAGMNGGGGGNFKKCVPILKSCYNYRIIEGKIPT